MQNHKNSLPIDDYLEEITLALSKTNQILLKASPGSGKTTRLPWYLASKQKGKVVVLEPRRIAAKLAAVRITQENQLTLGHEIGYRFRFETKMSRDTKLVFLTEGTFLKSFMEMNFNEIETVILDEFHERHVETDLALALLIQKQKEFPNLKLILMSATLDFSLKEYLSEAAIIDISTKRFNVEIEYLANTPSILNESLERKILNALNQIDKSDDVLIFLPGMREILKVKEYLHPYFGKTLILHGDLTSEEQSLVFDPSPYRKIILSSNIAESSVTIPGIRVVIDSGIQRELIYESWTGLKQLQDKPTTQDSAIQRAGRAGRETDGKCFRLYSKLDFENRKSFALPAIMKEDLLETYLNSLHFDLTQALPTPPPISSWTKAKEMALALGLASGSKLTDLGIRALNYPTDIRIGIILEKSKNLSTKASEKLLQFLANHFEREHTDKWKTRIKSAFSHTGTEENWEKYILHGFIDQVAKYRKDQNDFIHYSGKVIKPSIHLKDIEPGLYVILNVTRKEEADFIFPIEDEWPYEIEPFPLTEDLKIQIQGSTILFRQTTNLGRIVLEEEMTQKTWSLLNDSSKQKVLIAAQKKFDDELEEFKKSKIYRKFLLTSGNEEIIFSLVEYFSNNEKLNFHGLREYFESKLAHLNLNYLFPDKITLENKKEFIVHIDDTSIYLEAHIQDFFGLKQTPTLNNTPLTLKILGPHKRSVQVTKDLASFWSIGYKELLKEFRREYPRHHWPEDPTKAPPALLKRHLI